MKDIFQPSNISHTILRFHDNLFVNHNTLYHPITIDTITKKYKMLIAINSWLCELLVCGYEFKWLISVEFTIMRQSTIYSKNCHVQVPELECVPSYTFNTKM